MTDTPILQIKQTRSGNAFNAWAWRIAAMLLLMIGAEILLWTQITRPLWEWAINLVGYALIATLLLDFASRFQVRELFGALTLIGIFGLFSSLFLNPTVTLVNLPTSLFTRVLGAQFIAGVFALLLWLLVRGRSTNLMVVAGGALLTGGWWGVWVQQYPFFVPGSPTSAIWVLGAGGFVLLSLLIAVQLMRRPTEPADLRITALGWIVAVIVLMALLVVRLIKGDVPTFAWASVSSLIGFCMIILWFQNPNVANPKVPVAKGSLGLIALAAVLFVSGGLLIRFVPNNVQTSIFEVITTVYAAIGMLWLPVVVVVLGIRAYRQQLRTGHLL